MEINKKKHQLESGVQPNKAPYVATTTLNIPTTVNEDSEDIKRKNYTEWSEKNFKSPSHYAWFEEKFNIPSHKILEQFSFNIGNAMKYLIRHGRKKSMGKSDREKAIDDLKKAINFINFEIDRLSC